MSSWSRTSRGKPWRHEWKPGGRRQTVVTRRGLLAARTEPVPEESWDEVLARVVRRFAERPMPVRLLGLAVTLVRIAFAGTAEVVWLDPDTGAEAARADASALGPVLRLQRAGFGALLLGTGTARTVEGGK